VPADGLLLLHDECVGNELARLVLLLQLLGQRLADLHGQVAGLSLLPRDAVQETIDDLLDKA